MMLGLRRFLSNYSLARRATLATVLTLVAMLSLAGVALASLFLKGQIDESRASALTQANVASSTMSAAMRFGGYEVIAEALRVFDTGAGHDSAAVYDRTGKLRAEMVAPGEATFPPDISALKLWGTRLAEACPSGHTPPQSHVPRQCRTREALPQSPHSRRNASRPTWC